MNASWYAVKNVKDDAAEISIFDEIGLWGISAKQFAKELKSLGNRRLLVRINSPGGEIFEGNAIYNALRRHPGGADVAVDALAASMASVIAMVGDKRSMAENGMFMIHNPWSVAFGESKDFTRTAGLLDDLKENIISAYAGRTGMERKQLSSMMDEESWLTADEALEMGFITEITEPLQAYNSFERFDISKFNKLPKNFMAKKPEEKATAITAVAEIPAVIVVETPEVAAVIEESEEEKAVNSLKAEAALVPGLKAEIVAKDSEIVSLKAQVAEKTQEYSKLSVTYDRLKQSLAIAPAQTVANTPAVAEHKSLIDIFNAITDDAERAIFFKKHEEELKQFVNKPMKKAA